MIRITPLLQSVVHSIKIVKQFVVACFLGLFAVSVPAANVNIQWIQDSYSSVDVLFTGTGFDSLPSGGNAWDATITSPSGLWQLSTLNFASYHSAPDFSAFPIEVFNRGTLTFLGQLPPDMDPSPSSGDNVMHTEAYDDYFAASGSIQDGTPWGVPFPDFLTQAGWQGYNPINIDSMPVATDPATWTWSAEYAASGPSLSFAPLSFVPEPGSLTIIGSGILLLLGLRWNSRFWRTELRPIRQKASVAIASRRKK